MLQHTGTGCSVPRRLVVLGAPAAAAAAALARPARAADPPAANQVVLEVGPRQQHETIAAALAAAPAGALLRIQPGTYSEPLVVGRSVHLQAVQAGSVEVAVDTQQPYVHCLHVEARPGGEAGPHVVARGLRFSHASKSVANNYAVLAQAGELVLQDCAISSRSGSGAAVEGAALVLQRCVVRDCAAHGVAVFGALEGGAGSCQLSDCTIEGNKRDGVLARDGAQLVLASCSISGNGGAGLRLGDAEAQLQGGSTVQGNRGGCVVAAAGSTQLQLAPGLDEAQLCGGGDGVRGGVQWL